MAYNTELTIEELCPQREKTLKSKKKKKLKERRTK